MKTLSVPSRRRWSIALAVLLAVGLLAALNRPQPASSDIAPAASPPFTFGGGGDFGRSADATAVLRAIGGGGLSFFASVGDLSYSDNTVYTESQWCQYVKDTLNAGAGRPVGDPYGETFPFEIVSGNHEAGFKLTEGGLIDNYLKPTCLPDRLGAVQSPHLGTNPSATGNYGKEYYFDYPAAAPLARFLMLSPRQNFLNGGLYDYTSGSARLKWVSDRIDEARAAGVKWIIVGMHHNYITAGIKNDEVKAPLFNLLVSKRVDLILQGHDHTYQRSKQLAHSATCPGFSGTPTAPANLGCVSDDGSDGQYAKGAGTVLLIQGMGGVGAYIPNLADPEAPYFAKIMGTTTGPTGERTFGYNRFTISDTELSSEFVRGSGGIFSDGFRITQPGAGTPPPTTAPPTTAPPTTPPPDTAPPTTPGSLRAMATSDIKGNTQLELAWNAATDNVRVTGYDVYRDGTRVTTVPGTTYTDATVLPNSRYTYTVRARDAAGNVSPDSTPLTVTRTTVAEDATVLKSTPTSKNGATATLGADSSPVENLLTKFTVTGTAGKRIDKAVLRLRGSDPSNSGGAFRATTNTSWTESTVTWATAPAADGVSLGSVGGVTVGKWVDVDLAPLVKGDGTYSIRASSTSTDGVEYSSRNASTNRPEVVLTVTTP